MAKIFSASRIKWNTIFKIPNASFTVKRGVLSKAYLCDDAWEKRLESPLLKNIKMDQYFIDIDKKFGTKRLVSGVDIDLFGCNVQNESQLEEIEHLLYRFRRTKRAHEMMESTHYAVVKAYLKHKDYESLFRILNNRESYGVFPDLYSYNILMSTFLEEKLFREAAHVAVLMMLQEDFSNQISRVLGLLSCQTFLNECPIDTLFEESHEEVEEKKTNEDDDDEEEQTLVRVPFLRNPWFDDHFNLSKPQHLIGKTFYLIGRELNNPLGRSYQLVGLAMYEKWEKASVLLENFLEKEDSFITRESVEKFKSELEAVPDDEEKTKEKLSSKFNDLLEKMKSSNKIQDTKMNDLLQESLSNALKLQDLDIKAQQKFFAEWEHNRKVALDKQNVELEKERRLKAIEEKKDYLFWKEKRLYFFENEDQNLKELKKVDEITEAIKSEISPDESYVVPEMRKKYNVKMSKYKRLAKVAKLY